jgi:hypothetical protein
MTQQQAIKKAEFWNKRTGQIYYVIFAPDEFETYGYSDDESFVVADDDELSNFYFGCSPIYATD